MYNINYKLISENKELLSRNEQNNFDKLLIINDAIERLNNAKFKYDILSTLSQYNYSIFSNTNYINTNETDYTKQECQNKKESALKQALKVQAKFELYNAHIESKINKIIEAKKMEITEDTKELKTLEVYKNYYHSYLSYLDDDKRAFVDEIVIADKYYLVYNKNEVIGGFCTNINGYLNGLFSLKRGYGDAIQKLRIKTAIHDLNNPTQTKLTLFCCGDFLKEYYIKRGFKIDKIYKWDETQKHIKWDKTKHGEPLFYDMSRLINI